jgi:hypothetical protein
VDDNLGVTYRTFTQGSVVIAHWSPATSASSTLLDWGAWDGSQLFTGGTNPFSSDGRLAAFDAAQPYEQQPAALYFQGGLQRTFPLHPEWGAGTVADQGSHAVALGVNRLGHAIVVEHASGSTTNDAGTPANYDDDSWVGAQVQAGLLYLGSDTPVVLLDQLHSGHLVVAGQGTTSLTHSGATILPRFINDEDAVAGYRVTAALYHDPAFPLSYTELATGGQMDPRLTAEAGVWQAGVWHPIGNAGDHLILAGLTSAQLDESGGVLVPAIVYGWRNVGTAQNPVLKPWWSHQLQGQANGAWSAVESIPLSGLIPANPWQPGAFNFNALLQGIVTGTDRLVRNGQVIPLASLMSGAGSLLASALSGNGLIAAAVTPEPTAAEPTPVSKPVIVAEVGIKEVSFAGSGRHNIGSDQGVPYLNPVWRNNGIINNPIAFTGGTYVRMEATLQLPAPLSGKSVLVEADSPDGLHLAWPAVTVAADGTVSVP